MRLYEPVIYMRTSLAKGGVDTTRRTEALWNSLEAAKLFFQAWMAVPVGMVSYLPFPILALLTFGMVTTTHLFSLSDADWDSRMARREFDVADITMRLGDFLGEADQVARSEQWRRKRKCFNNTKSVMEIHREKTRWISNWYASRLLPAEELGSLDVMDLDSAILSSGNLDANFWQSFLDDNMGVSMDPADSTELQRSCLAMADPNTRAWCAVPPPPPPPRHRPSDSH